MKRDKSEPQEEIMSDALTIESKARIMNPPNFLRNKTKTMPGSLAELLAKADAAVGALKAEFEAGAEERIRELMVIFKSRWESRVSRDAAIKEMRQLCHDLKGEAGSFGYPLITQIADLFGDYLRETEAKAQRPEAVKSYIDTFSLVWAQRIQGDGGQAGRQLIASLMRLNEKSGVVNN
jgi:HPt (histidine-containing phosphotransfer) domain-containing protein